MSQDTRNQDMRNLMPRRAAVAGLFLLASAAVQPAMAAGVGFHGGFGGGGFGGGGFGGGGFDMAAPHFNAAPNFNANTAFNRPISPGHAFMPPPGPHPLPPPGPGPGPYPPGPHPFPPGPGPVPPGPMPPPPGPGPYPYPPYHPGYWPGPYYPGGWGAPLVAGAVAGAATAAMIGSTVYSLPPDCQQISINAVTYQQCGGNWYLPQFTGSHVVYEVVSPPPY